MIAKYYWPTASYCVPCEWIVWVNGEAVTVALLQP